MKILLTHRFFWPDTSPYGVILRIMGDELAEAGHDVRVFSSRPSYGKDVADAPHKQQLGKIKVRRIPTFMEHDRPLLIRIFNATIYCVWLFFHVLFSRADVVTACTFPPVLAAWCASLAARLSGARFIYHVQDIHPEVSYYSGGRLGHGLPMRALRWLDNQTLRRSSAIIVLSRDMAETLQARGLGDLPIHVINNPSLAVEADSVEPPAELLKPEGAVRLIFAGNLGRFQNLPLLAEGVALCFDEHPELELMFLGDGVALPELKARWGDHPQVRFAPFLPFAQARGIIADADIGLVSLTANIYRVAYPSKISTYRDLGLKILALVEPESEMARELARQNIGAVPNSNSAAAIGAALETLLQNLQGADAANTSEMRIVEPITWTVLVGSLEGNLFT